MGELDITKVCFTYNPFVEGYQSAMLTVFFSWAPLAVAGIGLKRTGVVHATMRGAGAMRMLAHLAIAIQAAALTFSLLFVAMFLGAFWDGVVTYAEFYAGVIVGVTFLASGVALSVAGIRGWHYVLTDLSHRGEARMLM